MKPGDVAHTRVNRLIVLTPDSTEDELSKVLEGGTMVSATGVVLLVMQINGRVTWQSPRWGSIMLAYPQIRKWLDDGIDDANGVVAVPRDHTYYLSSLGARIRELLSVQDQPQYVIIHTSSVEKAVCL